MGAKLESGQYKDRFAFEADFKLMINNAKTYNMPGSIVHNDAVTVDGWFDKSMEPTRRIHALLLTYSRQCGSASTRPSRLLARLKRQLLLPLPRPPSRFLHPPRRPKFPRLPYRRQPLLEPLLFRPSSSSSAAALLPMVLRLPPLLSRLPSQRVGSPRNRSCPKSLLLRLSQLRLQRHLLQFQHHHHPLPLKTWTTTCLERSSLLSVRNRRRRRTMIVGITISQQSRPPCEKRNGSGRRLRLNLLRPTRARNGRSPSSSSGNGRRKKSTRPRTRFSHSLPRRRRSVPVHLFPVRLLRRRLSRTLLRLDTRRPLSPHGTVLPLNGPKSGRRSRPLLHLSRRLRLLV